jgi:3-oxoacyl-[acyl-carrier-protein] synthase II
MDSLTNLLPLDGGSIKVVVTGMGMVNALGRDCATIWRNLLEGRTGVKLREGVPVAEVKLETPPKQKRVEQLLFIALKEAIATAALDLPLAHSAIVIGTSRGYQREWELILEGSYPVAQFPELLSANLSSQVAKWLGTQGLAISISTACASGNWAIAKGCELITRGESDLVVVGAVDSAITPLSMAGFHQLGILAKTGIYPFSREREGLGVGEGAAVLILEAGEMVKKPVYGKILGWGITNDAWHITSAEHNWLSAKQAIANCLHQSGLRAEDIDYINAHGTATINNDQMEAELIRQCFPHSPPVSSTKGATGHCLGATGLMEAIFCLLAIRDQVIPPCVNLLTPAFDLFIPRQAVPKTVKTALNLSFGFGGQNTVIALAGTQDLTF